MESVPAVALQPRNACEAVIRVEFVGAAGIGKSYMLAEVARGLMQRQIAVTNLDDVSLSVGLLRRVRVVSKATWVALQMRPRPLITTPRVVRMLAGVAIRSRYLPETGWGVCIGSEGVFHRLRQLTRMSRSQDMNEVAARVLPMVNPPDIVVILEARARKIFERRVGRNRPGDEFSLESVEKDVQMTEQSIKTVQFLGRTSLPGMKIIRCDLEEFAPKDACESILNHVEVRMRVRGSGGLRGTAHEIRP